MILYISAKITKIAEKFLPSTFVITIILTLIVAIISVIITESNPIEITDYWYQGFWELLSFTMQMAMVLILGYALASTDFVTKIIENIISQFNSTHKAVAYIAFFSMFVSFINWGLGLVFGAILARKFAEYSKLEKIKINYPLVGAAAYSGLLVWHGGLSGSAPLTVATENHFLFEQIGIIPVANTILSLPNLIVTVLLLTVIPLFFFLLSKKINPEEFTLSNKSVVKKEVSNEYFNDTIDNSPIINKILGALIVVYLISLAFGNATSLRFINLNYVNMLLLGLGIMLHRSIIDYMHTIEEVTKSAAGIILLFPFYAGIMGIMKYSGLTVFLSISIVHLSQSMTAIFSFDFFPFFTFMSSGLVNLFVPSGGGQWAVQGPIIMQSASKLNASYSQIIMAFSYGDQITNMLQPFWALPLLGITGLKAKQILPYTLLIMLISIPIFLFGIYLI